MIAKDHSLLGYPNTYTLTKKMAESLLADEGGNVPVVIVRPSAVTAALSEPLPGWLDNYKSCTGIVVAQQYTWAEMADAMQKSILRHPLPNAAYYPKFAVNNSYLWHNISLYCMRYLPARAADLGLMLIGRDPRYVQRYENIRKVMDVPRFFITHGWLFKTDNVSFNIDVRSLDWYPYWDNYLLGIRKYLFKADDSDIPKDRSHLNRLYVVRLSSKAFLLALTCQLLMTTTPPLW
ncbi:hypothetical protein MTO96_028338 [Rhipicephalus appendiculatus]